MYFPDQRHVTDLTTIRRERFLPEDAIGRTEVREGSIVNLRDIVARGLVPSRYVIVEAARQLHLKKIADLDEYLLVEVGARVEIKTPLAAHPKQRNRRVLSPVKGVVSYIADGRILVQETPDEIDLEAGVDALVVEVRAGRGVVLETYGALVQGVWGNNRRTVGALRIEPEDGLESIVGDDRLTMQYRGAIVVTRRQLKETGLMIMEEQSIAGLIAPSMEVGLIPQVLAADSAIMLTEGFGDMRMSIAVFNMLGELAGKQATLDTALPDRWQARRPEAMINTSVRSGAKAPTPRIDIALQPGSPVRLTRQPHAGQVGRVINLPKTPTLLDNGLRVMCAQVELVTGERVTIPLVNLEVFGK